MAREPKGSSRTSRYCARCPVYWPATVEYRTCPECGGDTYGVVGKEPLTHADAQRRVNVAAFERHYMAREAQRKGPTPEELGAEEAAVLIDLERRLAS